MIRFGFDDFVSRPSLPPVRVLPGGDGGQSAPSRCPDSSPVLKTSDRPPRLSFSRSISLRFAATHKPNLIVFLFMPDRYCPFLTPRPSVLVSCSMPIRVVLG